MIIDHVDQIELAEEVVQAHKNELNSLRYLAQGLHLLYAQVKRIEDKVLERLDPDLEVFMYGNAPELKQVPLGIVACSFHWYAVSACNYARMVGWIANAGDTKKAGQYVQQVLLPVYIWRNKIAAHFAKVDPRPEDTPADLAASVMFPISFHNDAFYAGQMRLSMTQHGQGSSSRTDMQWSLTHTHFELAKRYWPEQVPPGDGE
jgi:hypothetical protein